MDSEYRDYMEIIKKDARELSEFTRCGFTYRKEWQTKKWMLWKMSKEGDSTPRYELWKYRAYKNVDGSVVWRKPNDEDFGQIAWYIVGNEKLCRDTIEALMKVKS